MAPPRRKSPPPPPSPGLRALAIPALALAALLAVTAFAYAPSLTGPFVLDDWGTVQMNMTLRRPDALRMPSFTDLLGTARPLNELTLVLDWQAAGLDPHRYRVVNLLLHLATVVAAFGFLARLLARAGHPRAVGLALAVSALFALHPIQMDAAAYVAQRSEVMATLLYLVALILLDLAASRWRSRSGAASWAGGVVAWVVAMGAKAIAITVPAAFLADQAVVAPPGQVGSSAARSRILRALAIAAPVLLLAAWAAWLQMRTIQAHPEGGAGFSATPLGPGQYFLTQLRVLWLYLRLLAWPTGFAFDRTFDPSTSLDGEVALAGLGLVAFLALAGWLWLRAERADGPRPASRIAAFGILLWPIVLAPTSSFVPVMDLAVEHRVYLASIGPFLAAAVGVDHVIHRWIAPRAARWVALSVAIAVPAALAVLVHARAEVWGSVDAFWAEAARASPGSSRILNNYGYSLYVRGNLPGADAAYRRAWKVARGANAIVPLAANHAGVLIDLDQLGEALDVVDRALQLAPNDPGLRVNRAVALGKMGRLQEAIADARIAAMVASSDPRMRNVYAIALSAAGNCNAAIAEFGAAAQLDPGVPAYPIGVAACLASLGRTEEACSLFRNVAARTRMRPLPQNAAERAAAIGCPIQ